MFPPHRGIAGDKTLKRHAFIWFESVHTAAIDVARKAGVWNLVPEEDIADDHGPGVGPMGGGMGPKEVALYRHIAIEKDDDITAGRLHASVACSGSAPIGFMANQFQWKTFCRGPETVRVEARGGIVHHDEFGPLGWIILGGQTF